MNRRYVVSLAPAASKDLAEALEWYGQVDRDYGAGSNFRGRFLSALMALQERLAKNPRAFPPIMEYRFAILSRSIRHVVLFRIDEQNFRVRIFGVFGASRNCQAKIS
jgi:plasmid stabilization system protein ParE